MEIELKLIGGDKTLLPTYATSGSAAVDLRAAIDETLTLYPGEVAIIPTGIALNIGSPAICAKIYPRSGLGTKEGLVLANGTGVIDSDYQGEVKVAVLNRNQRTGDFWKDKSRAITITRGQRIAQMVFEPVIIANLKVVDDFSATTERGAGGFGSTDSK